MPNHSHPPAPRRLVAYLLVALFIGGLTYAAARHPFDFAVYYYTTCSLLEGNRDLYAPDHSSIRWPVNLNIPVYRYPPLFSLLFVPFVLLPLEISVRLWVLLKLVALYAIIRAVGRMVQPGEGSAPPLGMYWLIPFFVVAPSLVKEYQYGNVHFFVVAALVAGLYCLPRHPRTAAAFLAVGSAIKLFPLFFVPYLVLQRRLRTVTYLAVFLLLLALLPALYFGFDENLQLLQRWWQQSRLPAPSFITWALAPDHSLHGVLTRYLSTVPYSNLPDSNYRNINLANLSPRAVQMLWLSLALAAYAALLGFGAWRKARAGDEAALGQTAPLEYALLFCAMLLLSSYSHKTYFVALVFPALVLAHEWRRLPQRSRDRRTVSGVALVAILLFALPPLIPGRVNQRLLVVYSPDFFGTLLLAVCLILLLRARIRAGPTAGGQGGEPLAVSLFARAVFGLVNWLAARGGLQPEPSEDETQEGRERRRTGVRGETFAYWYLRCLGYRVVRRNYRVSHRRGEIDLIGWDGDVLAFVEVKTRTTDTGGPPEEGVDTAQREELRAMARDYLARRQLADVSYRFDLLALEARPGAAPVVRLHKGGLG